MLFMQTRLPMPLKRSEKIHHTYNNKWKKNWLLLLILTFIPISCGTILDSGKIIGTWLLETAEFYDYLSGADTYICYSTQTLAVGVTEPSDRQPVLGNFFFNPAITDKFYITFNDNGAGDDADGEFMIYFNNTSSISNYVVNSNSPGKWKLDTFNNRLTFSIPKYTKEVSQDSSDDKTFGIWQTEFTFSNDWPLSTPKKMELLIKAKDTGNNKFTIEGTGVDAILMKGYFTKQ